MSIKTPSPPGLELPSFEVKNGGPDLQFDDKQLEVLANEYALTNYKGEGFEDTAKWQARALERLRDLIRQPTSSLIYDGDRLVAVGGYDRKNDTTDGKPVLELTMAIRDPSYKGQNLGTLLYTARMDSIRTLYPDGIVSILSFQKQVWALAGQNKFTEVPLEEWLLRTNDERSNSGMEGYNFKAFIFNLGEVTEGTKDTAHALHDTIPEL